MKVFQFALSLNKVQTQNLRGETEEKQNFYAIIVNYAAQIWTQ